jgi:hypothetical protein
MFCRELAGKRGKRSIVLANSRQRASTTGNYGTCCLEEKKRKEDADWYATQAPRPTHAFTYVPSTLSTQTNMHFSIIGQIEQQQQQPIEQHHGRHVILDPASLFYPYLFFNKN